MAEGTYVYRFFPDIDLSEVEDSLMLAAMATEGLHGRSRVRLETRFVLDRQGRECQIEARTQAGRDLARIFTGLLQQQFGEDAFSFPEDSSTQHVQGGSDEPVR